MFPFSFNRMQNCVDAAIVEFKKAKLIKLNDLFVHVRQVFRSWNFNHSNKSILIENQTLIVGFNDSFSSNLIASMKIDGEN